MTSTEFVTNQLFLALTVVLVAATLVQGHVWWRIQRLAGRRLGREDLFDILLAVRRPKAMVEVFRYVFARRYAEVDSVWFRRECVALKFLYVAFFALVPALLFALFLSRG